MMNPKRRMTAAQLEDKRQQRADEAQRRAEDKARAASAKAKARKKVRKDHEEEEEEEDGGKDEWESAGSSLEDNRCFQDAMEVRKKDRSAFKEQEQEQEIAKQDELPRKYDDRFQDRLEAVQEEEEDWSGSEVRDVLYFIKQKKENNRKTNSFRDTFYTVYYQKQTTKSRGGGMG